MLTTCNRCHRRDYCKNCALKDDCYWMKAVPSQGGERLSCESFECKDYEICRKIEAGKRNLR